MKLSLDTASLDEIREAAAWGVLRGVTTNPTLIGKRSRTSCRDVVTDRKSVV